MNQLKGHCDWKDLQSTKPMEDGFYLVNLMINGYSKIAEARWDISNGECCFTITECFSGKMVGFWKENGFKRDDIKDFSMKITDWAFFCYPQGRK